MIVLSEYLQSSDLDKVTCPVNTSKRLSIGSLGVCRYRRQWRKSYHEIIQTYMIGEIRPGNSIVVYPVVSLDGNRAEIAVIATELVQDGLIWNDSEGQVQFILVDEPVRRTVIEDGRIIEAEGLIVS